MIWTMVAACRFDLPESRTEGAPPLYLEVLAGSIGGRGNVDDTGAAARFDLPSGVGVDSAGNAYVADENNHTIRKITAAGVVTTLAGSAGTSGSADGAGDAARFAFPAGVAVDGAGTVYVADRDNHTIRKITAAGVVTTLAGGAGTPGSADGAGGAARFAFPVGVAVDGAGTVYVADRDNHTIRKITAAGVVTTLAGGAGTSGSADGAGAAARFAFPTGVAVDGAGDVYVADRDNHTIRKVTAAGVVTTLAGSAGMSGSTDDASAAARFAFPSGIAVDGAGNLYVADRNNATIRKVTAGMAMTLAGTAGSTGSSDGAGAAARFTFPSGVAVDSAGNVYVADRNNSTIRQVTPVGVVTTLAGAASATGSMDGTGAVARFFDPYGVAVDGAGNIYVGDASNSTIRKVTATGAVTTLAGTAGMSGNKDGTGATARFAFPAGVAADRAGNVYVGDVSNSTIRKLTAAGAVMTLAGTGIWGSSDGTGPEARFTNPFGVAVDSAGNVYVADTSNHTIRKVTPEGVATTLAGTAGESGSADGAGAAARFNFPSAIAVDSADDVYVADTSNHTIRKITPAGVVTTLAGSAAASGSTDGTGAAARFNFPSGVAVDDAGDVYVADRSNSVIRKITAAGSTTTIAGLVGTKGIVLGTSPRFASPVNLAIVGDSIVISDANAILLLHHGASGH